MIRRVKQRYLLLLIDCAAQLESGDVKEAIWNAVVKLFGEYGASQSGLFLVQFDKEKKEAVLRCSNKALDLVRASVASINRVEDKPAAFHVLRISGTIRALLKQQW